MNLDTRIFYDINDFARDTPWLQPVMSGYANYGVALFAGLLLAGWWIARKDANLARMTAAVWAPLGMLAALGINRPVAAAINETRPCLALHDIVVLAPPPPRRLTTRSSTSRALMSRCQRRAYCGDDKRFMKSASWTGVISAIAVTAPAISAPISAPAPRPCSMRVVTSGIGAQMPMDS